MAKRTKQVHPDGFEIFKGATRTRGRKRRGAWFWRLWRAGRIVADGGESYTRRASVERAVRRMRLWLRIDDVPTYSGKGRRA